jgi:hypothetical protein
MMSRVGKDLEGSGHFLKTEENHDNTSVTIAGGLANISTRMEI